MDFDLRDWLLIIGPLFIFGVLIHGYWRMRRGRTQLKMALDKSFVNSADDEPDDFSYLSAELPNGGARVTNEPVQTRLNLDEDVPVLMEPVEIPGPNVTEPSVKEPVITAPASELKQEPGLAPPAKQTPAQPDSTAPTESKPEQFAIIHVLSDRNFDGQALLETLIELDMTLGDMSIFHRINAAGETEFSLANSIEPGTFNSADMAQLETPSVTMFVRVHELSDPVAAFDAMIEVAQKLVDEFSGELHDETHSVMTAQTIGHFRQQIQEYQFKYAT